MVFVTVAVGTEVCVTDGAVVCDVIPVVGDTDSVCVGETGGFRVWLGAPCNKEHRNNHHAERKGVAKSHKYKRRTRSIKLSLPGDFHSTVTVFPTF